jgi:pimeloyl-ACP methyl ester carboxylesterase
MTKATAVLIVHGGYFLPAAWTPFTNALNHAGFTVRCPRLPTCADTRPPTATLEDDVHAVQQAALELRDQGHSILVLAHSYGGVVASEAITPSFYSTSLTRSTNSNSKKNENENENEKKGGVVALIYLAAFLIQPSTTLAQAMSKHIPPSHVQLGDNADGTVYAQNAVEAFYNDLSQTQAEELARSNVTHNWSAVAHTVRGAPWMDLPTVYIQCARDRALVFELQQILVDDAVAATAAADNKGIERVTLDSGHCPFLSRPDEVLDIIKRVALAK